jgi:hypothetical protein
MRHVPQRAWRDVLHWAQEGQEEKAAHYLRL